VTLIYKAFDHRNSVPPKRTIFFRQVYDALFQDHDLAKGDAFSRNKESSLDSEDFHKLLRSLAFETFRSGRVSYSAEELANHIVASVKRSGVQVEPRRMISDLLKAVPIFLRDGVELKWAHKSFQEYFVSQYILLDMTELRSDLIGRMFNSPEVERYREVFRFLGECDLGLMRELCVLPFLEELTRGDQGAGPELSSLHAALDIYYVGNLTPAEDLLPTRALFKTRFDIEIGERRTAFAFGGKGSFVLMAALKDVGVRLLLLPVIDPRMFPEFSSKSRAAYLGAWRSMYGDGVAHINPDLPSFCDVAEKIGGVEYIEAACSLNAITRSVIESLRESDRIRRSAFTPCVLDGF